MGSMRRAVVVGSGPNGLAAAITLARRGVEVVVLEAADRPGGGARTSPLTLPGLLHDDCSAIHPLALLSPFFASFDLARHGLRWRWPDLDLAHPLGDGRVAVLSRDAAMTAASLGADGERWVRLFEPFVTDAEHLADEVLRPVLHRPRHLGVLARFGAIGVLPATTLDRWWRDEPARALLAGCAAHGTGRLDRPVSAAIGLLLATAAGRVGWPVAEGGSGAITAALVAELESLGGRVRTGVCVTSLAHVSDEAGGPADAVLLDTSVRDALQIGGDRIDGRAVRALRRFRYGPAAFKVDLAIRGSVPWIHPDLARAGTVHLGGTSAEIAEAERRTSQGRMPRRPFVLVAQQHLADPGRSAGDVHPLWAYAHVPHGYPQDATDAVLGQIERFAPGATEQVLAVHTRGPAALERHDRNYVGGDIGSGASDARHLVFRPRPALDPYRLGDGLFLCSSATPPGPGVHGMCGVRAAESALGSMARTSITRRGIARPVPGERDPSGP